jgi:histidinol-phosphate aminotransferase
MSVSRRRVLSAAVSAGVAHAAWPSWITARGREALVSQAAPSQSGAAPGLEPLWLDSNENPTGPCPAAAEALGGLLAKASRYPMRDMRALAGDIAARHATRADFVTVGCGSTEILVNAVRTFTSPTAGLVAPTPTFESPARLAQALGHPVVERPVTSTLMVDLDDLARHVSGAGLVFLCNPNNPTSTALSLDAVTAFVRDVRKRSPDTVVLLDEAYIEYADGHGVSSAEGLALSMPNVVVSRTFSKAFGMAGLRVGYALGSPALLDRMQPHAMPMGVNMLGLHAARAAVGMEGFEARECSRNAEVRRMVTRQFTEAGCRVAPSHTNFVMVDLGRDPSTFRAGCAAGGVYIGRRFPPLDTHVRISLGTLDEMERAWAVFAPLLS